jgi:hypothetical protein
MVRSKLGDPAFPVKAAAAPSTRGRTPPTPVAAVRCPWQTWAELLFIYRWFVLGSGGETTSTRGRMTADELLIGPLIERGGRFYYDIFTVDDGLKSSFGYRRIEEARHDRRSFLGEAARDPRRKVRRCETLSEFLRLVEAASRRPGAPPGGERKD